MNNTNPLEEELLEGQENPGGAKQIPQETQLDAEPLPRGIPGILGLAMDILKQETGAPIPGK